MAKYRKKPVVIEAVQFTPENLDEAVAFCGGRYEYEPHNGGEVIYITTLEGVMLASAGDFIIRGVNGEFYPCKPDIFNKTYEPVE
jgi:hypothetical protein